MQKWRVFAQWVTFSKSFRDHLLSFKNLAFFKITKILVVGNMAKQTQDVQVVEEHNYLGILLDSKLSWTPHINSLCRKVNCLATRIFT